MNDPTTIRDNTLARMAAATSTNFNGGAARLMQGIATQKMIDAGAAIFAKYVGIGSNEEVGDGDRAVAKEIFEAMMRAVRP